MSEGRKPGKQAATGAEAAEVKPDINDPLQELANTLAEVFKRVSVNPGSESAAATRNVKPPRVYSIGHNFRTWLSQFTQYVTCL